MTLRIDEAEKKASALRGRLYAGEAALKAFKWMGDVPVAEFSIGAHFGSAVDGHKDALRYLNAEFEKIRVKLVDDALRSMQRDIDYFFGKQKVD